MELKTVTYTDSGLSDLLRDFFNQFKNDKSYYYVDQIDSNLILQKPVEIDYNNFTPQIKEAIENNEELRVKQAIYRAVGEVFQTRFGCATRQEFQNEDLIKIKVVNCPNLT